MAEEATEEEVMAEVVDSHMDNSMEEVVDSSMAEVVDSHMDISMAEVVDNHMDNSMAGVVDSSTLYHPRHIWQQLQSQLPVPLRDNQRKKDKMKQPLGTLLTMSTKMKERESSKKIGTATRHRGLWHIDRDKMGHDASSVLAAIVGGKESMALVHHYRMGHMAFDKMFRVFPDFLPNPRSLLAMEGNVVYGFECWALITTSIGTPTFFDHIIFGIQPTPEG
ncbi:uncharacterized protein LOC124696957 [Lolium rigidum]|uniref:uncharacterized protein LOC124696957 n=1 Tax=Lolium rigidum TaxID=89674 RepID=UPI001F5D422B|nr:uncharacterized protein LOC124696957 [Lolium rigidum]